MKIWLDDIRKEPEGWVRCFWPEEVISYLEKGNVEEISLDHDLGDDAHGTGYDVITWIEEKVHTSDFVPPMIRVHSQNSVGVDKMKRGIISIAKAYVARK